MNGLRFGVQVGIYMLLSMASAVAESPAYQAQAGSTLSFQAIQAGARFEGRFEGFDADIRFSPAALDDSTFRVKIALNSVNTDYQDRDEILRGPDFFAVDRYPQAVFQATQFETIKNNHYLAKGTLTIRDKTQPVNLQFTFRSPSSENQTAQLEGSAVINRMDFDVGTGEWKDPKWVGHEVKVRFRLVLAVRP